MDTAVIINLISEICQGEWSYYAMPPPYTTHESQPLYSSIFKPLKQNWHDAWQPQVCSEKPRKLIIKYEFSFLLNKAWEATMIPKTISAGFRRSGIYPVNPGAFVYSPSDHQSNEPAIVAEHY